MAVQRRESPRRVGLTSLVAPWKIAKIIVCLNMINDYLTPRGYVGFHVFVVLPGRQVKAVLVYFFFLLPLTSKPLRLFSIYYPGKKKHISETAVIPNSK